VPRISIHYGDHWNSVYGVMLYPDSPELVRYHVIISRHAAGLSVPADTKVDIDVVHQAGQEYPRRNKAGFLVGQVTRALIGLIDCPDAPPSWAAAIKYAQRFYWSLDEKPDVTTSKIKEHLSLFAPVLHLWCAAAQYHRDSKKLHRPDDPRSEEEAAIFVATAMSLRAFLLDWDRSRARSYRSQHLAGDAFTPWAGAYAADNWLPHAGDGHLFEDQPRSALLTEADGAPIVKPRGWQKGRPRRSAAARR